VLSSNAESSSVGASENHWTASSTSRHVKRFCGTVNNLIDGLHGEIESHELADWLHAATTKSGSDSHTSEAHFGNWSVNDSVLAVLSEKAAGDLVCAIVLGDFLADQNDSFISFHFLIHRHVERITHEHLLWSSDGSSERSRG